MTDPTRFRDGAAESLERLLFEAALDDSPAPGARQRLAGALTASTVVLTATSAAASVGKGGLASGASSGVASLLLKSVLVGVVATGGVLSIANYAGSRHPATPTALRRPPVLSKAEEAMRPEPPPTAAPSAAEPVTAVAPAPRSSAVHEAEPLVPERALDDVSGQRDLVERARAALSADRASVALKLLNQYEATYGFGLLGHEEAVLGIEARFALDRRADAAARAHSYLTRYPKGTQVATVEQLLRRIEAPTTTENRPKD